MFNYDDFNLEDETFWDEFRYGREERSEIEIGYDNATLTGRGDLPSYSLKQIREAYEDYHDCDNW